MNILPVLTVSTTKLFLIANFLPGRWLIQALVGICLVALRITQLDPERSFAAGERPADYFLNRINSASAVAVWL